MGKTGFQLEERNQVIGWELAEDAQIRCEEGAFSSKLRIAPLRSLVFHCRRPSCQEWTLTGCDSWRGLVLQVDSDLE